MYLQHTESVLVVSLTGSKRSYHRAWRRAGPPRFCEATALVRSSAFATLERDKLKVELTRLAGLPAAEKTGPGFNAARDL
jgi:hypothetical protein